MPPLGENDVGLEIGMTKSITILSLLESLVLTNEDPMSEAGVVKPPECVQDGSFMETLRWFIGPFQKIRATFRPAANFAELKKRALFRSLFL